ncbi:MAG: hypothetical protein NUW01_06035 [Gemmatimonadaceae bacterium]|nr:hypothetical protein [Gemmatimonadaceae bacterium]
MTVLSPPLASQVARSLGHAPGPWRDYGVMRSCTCQRCGAVMVENVSDGKGVTGGMVEKPCGGKVS